MADEAKLLLDGNEFILPVITGTENEKAIDVSTLRSESNYITLDEGYGNTGSCVSKITFIDGENGILRYRGYPIEELANRSTFIETAYLIIYGRLPTEFELKKFSERISRHELINENMKHHFEGFPNSAHPMAILSAMVNTLGCFYPESTAPYDATKFDEMAAMLLSSVRTIASFTFRMSRGLPIIYPNPTYNYTTNFLHMMFSQPYQEFQMEQEVIRALDLIFLLHADHEQNCSTSTVRMVASSKANLFASVASGICALWGPLHGGANQAVVSMLQEIYEEGDDGTKFIEAAKSGKRRLMGFGHRVYKNYDPRARIIKERCDALLEALDRDDPLLNIAEKLEVHALEDNYFVERKLYPNVDFYSGIIMRAIGIPLNMFPVMFAIGRMPGWIANFKEVAENPAGRIARPRQIYDGFRTQSYTPMRER